MQLSKILSICLLAVYLGITLINWYIFSERVVGQELEVYPIMIELFCMLMIFLLREKYKVIKILLLSLTVVISFVGFIFIMMASLQCVDTGRPCVEIVNKSNILYGILFIIIPFTWAIEGLFHKLLRR